MSASVFGTTVRVLMPLVAFFLTAVLTVLTDDPDFRAVDGDLPTPPRADAAGFFAATVLAGVGRVVAALRGADFFATGFLTAGFLTAGFFAATFFVTDRVAAAFFFAAGFAAAGFATGCFVTFLAALAAGFFAALAAGFDLAFAADFARLGAAAFFVARPVCLLCAMTTLTLLPGGPVL